MKTLILILAMFLFSPLASADIKSQSVDYKHKDTVLEGYLVHDDSVTEKRPGILLFHEWLGLNDYIKSRADMLAKLGYTVLAADVYGEGVRPSTVEEASKEASKYKNDRALLRERAKAGLNLLTNQPNVDPYRIAAVGYCFGGLTALELGRAGADLKAVVSIHGNLASQSPDDAKNIKGKVLVQHGTDDPFVKNEEVEAFENNMQNAKIPYQLIKYPGAAHGFTNPANKGEVEGALYNEEADKKSWQDLKEFLTDAL